MDPRHEFGRAGECAAEEIYKQDGYRVIARNYRTRRGEIDLVAERDGQVVFVEVKARNSGVGRYPLLSGRQRRSLHRAARVFLLREAETVGHWNELRFDIVLYAHGRVVERIEGESLY